ncbi:MAG: hypothetical protein WA937_05605 [Flavobacteriales bacterium]
METCKRKVVLHIGWPKTGTTTLQKHVFPQLTGYRYLGTFPDDWTKSNCTTEIVHLLAFASVEKIDRLQALLWESIRAKEIELFGTVDESIPLILSEEAILSSLLRVSDHQHHGFCTASLEQILDRLLFLEARWNVLFDILLSERDPIEILHAYYAQAFFLFRRVPALDSFPKYLATGLREHPMRDLGFTYLKPGYALRRIQQRMGKERVFSIAMKHLFTTTIVQMNKWYPAFPEVPITATQVENKRSLSKNTKLSHFRPLWVKRKPFHLKEFLRSVKWIYMEKHAGHDKLEVPIILLDKDRKALSNFFFNSDGAQETHKEGLGGPPDNTNSDS